MGNLRFLLALSVVFAHAGVFMGFSLGDGRLAVQTFYMISGFYMSLVWFDKYAKLTNPIRTFYISRALRIYPLYFIVLGVAVLMGVLTASSYPAFDFFGAVSALGWGAALWTYFTQVTLIGMDVSLFIDYSSHNYMVLSVAWTLGLELTFYLLVPFLLPRIKVLVSVLVLSLAGRVLAFINGATDDPALYDSLWSYRFFPFEIALFLAGALAHRVFSQLPNRLISILSMPEMHFLTVLLMVGGLCYFKLILSVLGESTYWLYYAIAFIGLIVLFYHTRSSKQDSYVGELSYPMYILHMPVLWAVGKLLSPINAIYIVIPLTILSSMVLVKIQSYVDVYRHNLIEKQKKCVNSQKHEKSEGMLSWRKECAANFR